MDDQYSELLKRQETENIKFAEKWHKDKKQLIAMDREEDLEKIDEHYTKAYKELTKTQEKEREDFFETKKEYKHPVTDQEITKEQWEKAQEFLAKHKERQNDRNRDRERERER